MTILVAFNKDSKAARAACDFLAVDGEGAISERTAHGWSANSKIGILSSRMHLILAVQLCLMKSD